MFATLRSVDHLTEALELAVRTVERATLGEPAAVDAVFGATETEILSGGEPAGGTVDDQVTAFATVARRLANLVAANGGATPEAVLAGARNEFQIGTPGKVANALRAEHALFLVSSDPSSREFKEMASGYAHFPDDLVLLLAALAAVSTAILQRASNSLGLASDRMIRLLRDDLGLG